MQRMVKVMSDCEAAGYIGLRRSAEQDREFLYLVYASTRAEEMALTGWSESEKDSFLQLQFQYQDSYYRQNYPGASYDIILTGDVPIGRLYVDRKPEKMNIIDIALLPQYRRQGIGGRIFRDLLYEADQKGQLVCLHVEMNNPVRSFYNSLGFVEINSYGIYYYMERPASGRAYHAETTA